MLSISGDRKGVILFTEPKNLLTGIKMLFFLYLESSTIKRVIFSFYLFRSVTVCFLCRFKKSKPFISKIEKNSYQEVTVFKTDSEET